MSKLHRLAACHNKQEGCSPNAMPVVLQLDMLDGIEDGGLHVYPTSTGKSLQELITATLIQGLLWVGWEVEILG